MLLVDTSVWIEVFRKGGTFRLERIVDFEEVATCLPVIQEVLQGFRDETAFLRARESMFNLPLVESPLSQGTFEEAVDLYRRARRQGLSIRSSADCLIAACALRHGLTVLHRDRDFHTLARVSALHERSV